MKVLLRQLEHSLGDNLYYLSLMSALTIPDIAGAMDAEDGIARRSRYATWWERYARPQFAKAVSAELGDRLAGNYKLENPLTGQACYRFRCSLLHQGRSHGSKGSFPRIIFIE